MRMLLAAWMVITCWISGARLVAQPQGFEHRWAGSLYDVHMTSDGTRLWTVEDGGRIRHRNAAGQWSYQAVPAVVKDTLQGIHFVDNLFGWAVGFDGWVLRTLDGGVNWVAQFQMGAVIAPAQHETMYDVHFLDLNRGWLVGERGMWYTTNGGMTWPTVHLVTSSGATIDPTTIELYKIDVVERGSGILGLAVGEPGIILRNTNAQGSQFQVIWEVQSLCGTLAGCEASLCPPLSVPFEMWDVEISRNVDPTKKLALAVGGVDAQCGMAFSSTDDGLTWTREPHECEGTTNCVGNPLYNNNPGTVTDTWRHQSFKELYGVAILDADNSGVAVGYNGQHVVRDPALGIWRDRSSFSTRPLDALTAVVFPLGGAAADLGGATTGGLAELVGAGGHARRSNNVFNSWSDDLIGEPWRISDVHFVNDQEGWQVGQFFRIARTTTGGLTWNAQTSGAEIGQPALAAIAFNNMGLMGVAVGEADTRMSSSFQNFPKILHTTAGGGGSGWSESTSIGTIRGTNWQFKALQCVTWVTGSEFWCAGQAGLVYQTMDGGVNWSQVADQTIPLATFQRREFAGVSFRDSNNGVFVGSHPSPQLGKAYAYRKIGFNITWTDISPTNADIKRLTDVEVLGNTAYAVGEKVTAAGVRSGVVLRSGFSGGAFNTFTEMSPQPAVPACTIGFDLNRVAVLNQIALHPTNGDIWVGGECGRVWRFTGGAWSEQKSTTSSHVQGMSMTPSGYLYFGCMRQAGELQSVVRWHP